MMIKVIEVIFWTILCLGGLGAIGLLVLLYGQAEIEKERRKLNNKEEQK